MGEVTHLWRFAVKGLDRDELRHVELSPGLGFPNDRRWALQLVQLPPVSDDPEVPAPAAFDPQAPVWIHKQCFLCAFTAGEALGALETSYHDDADCLTVRRRRDGKVLLRSDLASGHPSDRRRVEEFFSRVAASAAGGCTEGDGSGTGAGADGGSDYDDDSDGSTTKSSTRGHSNDGRSWQQQQQLRRPAVRLVQSAVGAHHFGNTPVGFRTARRPDGDPSGSVLHLVNAETVRALSAAAGLEDNGDVGSGTGGGDSDSHGSGSNSTRGGGRGEGPLAPSRFRPNIVLAGVPAWAEFGWVGKHVRIGAVTLHVLARTVRCRATHVDARGGSGRAVLDVPALLQQHFPEHGPFLGVYARVVEGGALRVGDVVHGVVPDPNIAWAARRRRQLLFLLLLVGGALAALAAVCGGVMNEAGYRPPPGAA